MTVAPRRRCGRADRMSTDTRTIPHSVQQLAVLSLSSPIPARMVTGSRALERASGAIIAPETSEQAQRLRSSGWIARAGWLSHASDIPIWLVRFELPSEHVVSARGCQDTPAGDVAIGILSK
jgi:hypothetical protein